MIRLAKGSLHIAITQLLMIVFAVIDESIAGVDIKNNWRAGLDCLLHIQHMRERFPVNCHLGNSIARARF
jgi:hypothetical protein